MWAPQLGRQRRVWGDRTLLYASSLRAAALNQNEFWFPDRGLCQLYCSGRNEWINDELFMIISRVALCILLIFGIFQSQIN